MSSYTWITAHLLFPLHERFKGHSTVAIRDEMEQRQWQPQESILAYQNERLRWFVKEIVRNVPYYKSLFAELGIHPAAIQSIEDLQKLPLLTKDIIRSNSDALRADNARGLARFNTGGSSGEPLVFSIGKERVSHDVAAKWRATRWWDVDIGDRELVLWGSPIELGKQDYVKWVRDKLLRTELLPAFEMSESKMNSFLDRIESLRPKMLFGYPSAFALLAEQANAQNRALNNLGIKVAFVTSEKLYDHQRTLIEQTLGCPVANGYGGRDAGFIAHQCPQGNMHITADDIIVEIIDTEGRVLPTGESGEVVTTHLATRDYPFVRYRTGDIGVLGEENCACGRGLPILKEIQGRSTDFIIAADGTIMHGLALIYVVRDLDSVKEFKIIQESQQRTRVLVVPYTDFDEAMKEKIVSGFQERLGSGVTIDVEIVTEIPLEQSGKMRYVVSRVAQC